MVLRLELGDAPGRRQAGQLAPHAVLQLQREPAGPIGLARQDHDLLVERLDRESRLGDQLDDLDGRPEVHGVGVLHEPGLREMVELQELLVVEEVGHLEAEEPVRPQDPPDLQEVVVGDRLGHVLQDKGGVRQVDRPVGKGLQVVAVAVVEADVRQVGQSARSPLDHLGRDVDAVDLAVAPGQVLHDPADPAADLEHDGVAVGQRLPEGLGVVAARHLEGRVGVLVGDRADGVDRGRLVPEPPVAAERLLLQGQLLQRVPGEPVRGVRQLHQRTPCPVQVRFSELLPTR
jgi:hypothetical protein